MGFNSGFKGLTVYQPQHHSHSNWINKQVIRKLVPVLL